MAPSENRFVLSDGVALELDFTTPPSPRGALVFWPCTFGDGRAAFYEVPTNELTSLGWAVLRYLPRSHGASGGSYSVAKAAEDLTVLLQSLGPLATVREIFAVGHSGGCAGLLRTATRGPGKLQVLECVAPILNARESLEFMYQRGNIRVFVDMLVSGHKQEGLVRKRLADPSWLKEEVWEQGQFERELDFPITVARGPTVSSLGAFLGDVFVRAVDSYHDLQQMRQRTTITLPSRDIWFPTQRTLDAARRSGIPVHEAPDGVEHFLKGCWRQMIWTRVLARIRELA